MSTAHATQSSSALSLCDLNEADSRRFVQLLGSIVEHSPWVTEAIAQMRPFASVDALWTAIVGALSGLATAHLDDLFRLHPELAGAEAVAGRMTDHSTSEQGRLGLTALERAEFERLARWNATYRERFGFPCIIALRLHPTRASVFETFESRLTNDVAIERVNNLREIGQVVRGRLYTMLRPVGWLSTHVLDTAHGQPAAGLRIDLSERLATGVRPLGSVITNADGRTDERLLDGAAMMPGRYRLEFFVADYFQRAGSEQADPPFLDIVPIDFAISDPNLHYHVPLLCTPWSYSTYRGS